MRAKDQKLTKNIDMMGELIYKLIARDKEGD